MIVQEVQRIHQYCGVLVKKEVKSFYGGSTTTISTASAAAEQEGDEIISEESLNNNKKMDLVVYNPTNSSHPEIGLDIAVTDPIPGAMT